MRRESRLKHLAWIDALKLGHIIGPFTKHCHSARCKTDFYYARCINCGALAFVDTNYKENGYIYEVSGEALLCKCPFSRVAQNVNKDVTKDEQEEPRPYIDESGRELKIRSNRGFRACQ
jgi:hypothetical protein